MGGAKSSVRAKLAGTGGIGKSCFSRYSRIPVARHASGSRPASLWGDAKHKSAASASSRAPAISKLPKAERNPKAISRKAVG
jgi:hypothetical protein